MDEKQVLKDAVRQVMQLIISRGRPLTDELKGLLSQAIQHVRDKIIQIDQTQQLSEQATVPLEIPQNAKLLWILSGGNPEVFHRYLSQFPGRGLLPIALDPNQFNRVTAQLQQQMPQGQAREEDGIPKAPLQSSNIYGFVYDPESAQLFVRFNEGAIYKYGGVPPIIAQLFGVGAGTAKTTGRNKWGKFWPGKSPSMGAALNELIKRGGYPYSRVK